MRGDKKYMMALVCLRASLDGVALQLSQANDELKKIESAQDANIAIQQGAVADLPAADSGIVKVETALSVYKEYLLLYENTSFKPTFFGYCQQQLTALAGR